MTPDDTLRAQDEDATLKKIRGVVRNDTDADFIKKKGMINRLILKMEKVHTIVLKKFGTKVLVFLTSGPLDVDTSRTIGRV